MPPQGWWRFGADCLLGIIGLRLTAYGLRLTAYGLRLTGRRVCGVHGGAVRVLPLCRAR
ncbi:hypothetical protein NKW53_07210 [Acetobacter orientalis]|uniref:hypothetical protein n=1 Tax=Acetobacter orientalis TaxID=146474 RepID=UPI00209D9090|nr:hypothetical protein [Acetobacter orientalis]MCP1215848.1 hypothetical protein [Acetobacter orientalis]MCP1217992.1 hypothetical protein [Acetobacter orientalis]